LDTSKENNQKILEEPIDQIFTQMIYRDIPFESNTTYTEQKEQSS
jgi:hypothetical protein